MDVIVADKIDKLGERVEYYGGGILSPLEDLQDDVNELANKGTVKSVQRGIYSARHYENGGPITIPISDVDTTKSQVSIYFNPKLWFGGTLTLNSTSIVFDPTGSSSSGESINISWEVTEFY